MKLVIIESPYAAAELNKLADNITYARRCISHSIFRGEAPFASHLLYTQPGILEDLNPNERALGILCGFEWGKCADIHAFYTDRGWSGGMIAAYQRAAQLTLPMQVRALFSEPKYPTATQLGVSPEALSPSNKKEPTI